MRNTDGEEEESEIQKNEDLYPLSSSKYRLKAQKRQRPSERRSVLVSWWTKTYSETTK